METNINKASPYRADIDGLRAIAIIFVVLFHYSPHNFKGGFVGVDVFFVISGFLITGILLKNLQDSTFSYVTFLEKRVRRIFPSLAAVLLFTFAMGLLFLFPRERIQLGQQIIGGCLFVYNLIAAQDVGYFDGLEATKPLLHLWSLGIEEQFYFIWPLTLFVIWPRFALRIPVTLGLLIVSFILNVFFIHKYPTAVFYLPFTRFWELLIGSTLAIFMNSTNYFLRAENYLGAKKYEQVKSRLSFFGLFLIFVSFVTFSNETVFPGVGALLPTVGTALIIMGGKNSWLNRRILAHKGLVFIGLISYPLYLWHWSFLIWSDTIDRTYDLSTKFADISSAIHLSSIKIIALIASVIASIATYYLIEKKFRTTNNRRTIFKLLVLVVAVIPCLALTQIYYDKTWSMKDDRTQFLQLYDMETESSAYRIKNLEAYRADCSFYGTKGEVKPEIDPSCTKIQGRPVILLWGDSHVQHLRYGIEHIKSELSTSPPSIIQITSGSCPPNFKPMEGNGNGPKACNISKDFAHKVIAEIKPETIIIGQASEFLETDWKTLFTELKSIGVKNIILVGPAPRWDMPLPQRLVGQYWPNLPRRLNVHLKREFFEYDIKLKELVSQFPEVDYASSIGYFCNHPDGCLVTLDKERRQLTSHDSGHLTPEASQLFAQEVLLPILQRRLDAR